jgi:hypothetical protein
MSQLLILTVQLIISDDADHAEVASSVHKVLQSHTYFVGSVPYDHVESVTL